MGSMHIATQITAGLLLAVGFIFLLLKRKSSFLTARFDNKIYTRQYKFVQFEVSGVFRDKKKQHFINCSRPGGRDIIPIRIPDEHVPVLLELAEGSSAPNIGFCHVFMKEININGQFFVSPLDGFDFFSNEKVFPDNYNKMLDSEDIVVFNRMVFKRRLLAIFIILLGLAILYFIPALSIILFLYAFLLLSQNVKFSKRPDEGNWFLAEKEVIEKRSDTSIEKVDEQGIPFGFDDWSDLEKEIYKLYDKYGLPYYGSVNKFEEEDVGESSAEVAESETHAESVVEEQARIAEEPPVVEKGTTQQPSVENVPKDKPKKIHPLLKKNKRYSELKKLLEQELIEIDLVEKICEKSRDMLVACNGNVSQAFQASEDDVYFRAFKWTKGTIEPELFVQLIKSFILGAYEVPNVSQQSTQAPQKDAVTPAPTIPVENTTAEEKAVEEPVSIPSVDEADVTAESKEDSLMQELNQAQDDEPDRGSFEDELYGESDNFLPTEFSPDDSFDGDFSEDFSGFDMSLDGEMNMSLDDMALDVPTPELVGNNELSASEVDRPEDDLSTEIQQPDNHSEEALVEDEFHVEQSENSSESYDDIMAELLQAQEETPGNEIEENFIRDESVELPVETSLPPDEKAAKEPDNKPKNNQNKNKKNKNNKPKTDAGASTKTEEPKVPLTAAEERKQKFSHSNNKKRGRVQKQWKDWD